MNILITGKNSYVGNSISDWLTKCGYNVDKIEVRSKKYKSIDYTKYDVLIHAAAVVHKKDGEVLWETYHQVNTLLPVEIAKLAKKNGVKQFIFLSTMAIYGQNKKLPDGNVINLETPKKPVNDYGKSKLEAEERLNELNDSTFKVVILRPPSIYGKNCPGNYINTFQKIAEKIPVFPKVYLESKQSFIFIDNLCELVRLIIFNESSGEFNAQDVRTLSTVELLQIIAAQTNSNIKFISTFNLFVKLLSWNKNVNKLFGGVSYDLSDSNYFDGEYQLMSPESAFKYLKSN